MAVVAAVLLLCVGLCVGQGIHPWDPIHDDPGLDLGDDARLVTTDGEDIRVLVDNQHDYVVIKSLTSHTCFLISMDQSHMTADEIVLDVELNGEDILRTEFRPMNTLPPDDVQQDFGHRVARFCLHNPTFVTQRILAPPVGR